MFRWILIAISCFSSLLKAEQESFAHFLEPGFPFCEIVVDARDLGKDFPENNLTPRGVVIRLNEDSYIAYDTDLCRMAVAWSGGFLTEESLASMSYHHPKKKKGGGQKKLPSIIGIPFSANPLCPGVQAGHQPIFQDPRPAGIEPKEIGRGALPEGMARWVSATVLGERVMLTYEIGDTKIDEIPASLGEDAMVRYFQVSAHDGVTLMLGSGACEVIDAPSESELKKRNGINYLVIKKSKDQKEFAVIQSAKEFQGKRPKGRAPEAWRDVSAHWPHPVQTKGVISSDTSDYVVDSIALPTENPERRNIRPIDIAFSSDGSFAVVVTFDGDLWKVRGLEGDLQKILWQRIASGLHEPSSVRIRDGEIFVFGRNGLTKVTRHKGKLVYENHCSDFWQSAETRDFAHSLSIDEQGDFFISKGGQQNDWPSKHSGRALKISRDGKEVHVVSSGLRNAYLGIRPGTDELYASDQQGHWVPATPIHRIEKGGYYGFEPAAPWNEPEPEITPPLCWIPHTIAGSGLGVIWADQKRFGPLSDSLVYLDFRRPGILRTYLHDRDGQAASVPMQTEFDFPLLKGAVNPADGQLYLVGFQIWGTNSEAIRGMARLRYTGAPSVLPQRIAAGKHGVTLSFDQPLDPSFGTITARRWNYQRSATYGSGHYQPDGKAGEELLPVSDVVYSADRRSILVATPELEPVDQLAVSYELKTASGDSISNVAYLTLHHTSPLDLEEEGFLEVDLVQLAATAKEMPSPSTSLVKPTIERGAILYQSIGCAACHSVDGTTKGRSGPSWKHLAGSERNLLSGETVIATTDYLREAILDPAAKVAKGYNPKDVGMPSYRGILPDSDIESLVLYIESL